MLAHNNNTVGSLGSLAPIGGGSSSLRGGFSLADEEETKGPSGGSTVLGRGSGGLSSLGSLAPLGGGRSNIAASSSSSGGGLGSLTSIGANKPRAASPPASSFDLDEGLDALISDDAPLAATKKREDTTVTKKDKKKSSFDDYSDEDSDGGKKKSKKKSKKKEDEKPVRTLPSRKLPTARPNTAPLGDFDDDSLFGISKKPATAAAAATESSSSGQTTQRRTSLSKSRNDWDEEGGEADNAEEPSQTRSGESTARKVSALMRSKERADSDLKAEDAAPPPPQSFAAARREAAGSPPVPVSTNPPVVLLQEEPKPATFGSRRRAKSDAERPQAPPATAPPAATSTTATAAPAPSAFHIPGSDEPPAPFDAESTRVSAAPSPTNAPAAFDPDSIVAAAQAARAAEKAAAAKDASSDDPFGGLEDPMDQIDEKQGNLFSGFGAARPTTATQPQARQRRALGGVGPRPGAIGATQPAAAAGGRLNSAPAQSSSNMPVRGPSGVVAPPNSTSNTLAVPSAGAASAASGPPGPCVAPNLQLWYEWLGVNPKYYADEKLIPIAQSASQCIVPKHWNLINGWWVNTKTGKKHNRHPYLKHFLSKIDSKKLALQFNVEDEDSLDESLVASGDEVDINKAINTPSSTSRMMNRSLDDINPLSPASPNRSRKLDFQAVVTQPAAPATHAHAPESAALSRNSSSTSANAQPAVSSLSINTATSTPANAAALLAANVTPYYGGGYPSHSPPLSNASSVSSVNGGIMMLPAESPVGLASTRSQVAGNKLESVPERNGIGTASASSIDELLASNRDKHARLAELDRQSAERIAAATAAAATASVYPPGSAMDSVRVADLQNQLRLAHLTIEELEKRKRVLSFELEQADVHLSQLLSEQRARFEAQAIENERKARSELELKRQELSRLETSYQSRLAEVEDKYKSAELRRNTTISEAVQSSESKSREALDHALRLAAQNAESQRLHYEREMESLRALHANEIASLKQQQHDSVFLRSLVTQVENSAANLETLSKKVYAERSSSEKLTYEQLTVRDQLLKEKETHLEKERKQNEELLATFQRVNRETDEEKVRLREEGVRLVSLQNDLKTESQLLREQLMTERDQLRKDRQSLQQQREAWELKYKRELAEIDLKKELNERTHVQALEGLEETQRERAEILKQLDEEREELRVEKRAAGVRRSQLDAAEQALRADENEFQTHVNYFETRMQELTVLGAKVKAQSQDVAEQYNRLNAERALIDAARKEAKAYIDEGAKFKQAHATISEQLREEKKEHEKEKVRLLAQQKQVMLDREMAAKELALGKSIAGLTSGLPTATGHHYIASSPLSSPFSSPSPSIQGSPFAPAHSPLPSYLTTAALAPVQALDLHALGLAGSAPVQSPPSVIHTPHASPLSPRLATAFAGANASPVNGYSAQQLSAALASLSSQTEHLRDFLSEEKIHAH